MNIVTVFALRYGTMPRRRKHKTNADRQRAYRKRNRQRAWLKSGSSEWETPQKLFTDLDGEFHFTIDVAATPENAKCPRFFTRQEDGLIQNWEGTCFCNPPYGPRVGLWIKKAQESARRGATVVCLIPARTDTTWWHDFVMPYGEVRFIRGRLRFGNNGNSAPFPSAVVVFR
jgi:phage N-6-adenine-methyltransferase